VEPGVLFSIETEHIIEFMVGDEITVEEINSNIREIIAPLGAEVSYIVASITKEMIGSRMILPPILNLNTADKQ
jgi:5-methylcytosine-specific restriction endonuclease McrBC GTP-binding regulatory subunit McrB